MSNDGPHELPDDGSQTLVKSTDDPRFPTAILATGLVIVGFLCVFTGLILDTVVRGRREVRRLAYLALPAVGEG